jgi:protein-L-isoaspartate O-methyltransferase
VDPVAVDPVDRTLAAYRSTVEEYVRGTAHAGPAVTAYLDQVAGLAAGGTVLELGSGPGRDADYLESRGAHVVRTDATPGFVDRLRAAG